MGAASASQHHAGRGDPVEHRMKRLFPGSKWLAAAAAAALACQGPSWISSSSSSASVSSLQTPSQWPRARSKVLRHGVVKVDVELPHMQLPKDSTFEDDLKLERTNRSPGPIPPELQRIHRSAVHKILQGLRLSLRRLTAILPTGLGDGAVGAQVVKEHWSKVTMRPFRVLVLVPSDMVQETEARYKAIAGDGLFVMRIEPGGDGTDKLVQAMSQCSGLVMVGGYSDVMHFVRAHRRSRAQLLNLLVCEMAHAALGADKDAEKVVMNWENAFRVKVLQSVFISGQSLEPEPIRGLEEATMDVPGVPTYKVVARPGGPGGPEVFRVSTEQAKRLGLTVPLKLVALPASGDGLVQGLAELSAWGIREVEAIPAAAGGGSAKAVEYLNGEVQKRVGDAVKVQARTGEDTPDALLVAGNELDPSYLLQARWFAGHNEAAARYSWQQRQQLRSSCHLIWAG
ncbi:Mgat1 [Symbiodinium sp. CCMP2592]|nr:Mgat1 [Symbiodinium sp. CCMP2592]